MRRWFWLLGSLLILGVWPLLAQTPGGAHWRVGHFAVDVPEIDVYLDNTIVLQQVTLAAINSWRDLPSGAHTISITPAGGTLDRPLLQPFTLNAQVGQWVTLALAGRRTDGTLKLHAVVEDMRPIANGLTRLSVFNAFPNNPPLNIFLNETEIIRRLAYPGTLPEGNDGMESRDVMAGSYSLTIELTDGRSVKDLPNVGLGVGRAYLLVIFGTLDRPFPLLVATEIGSGGTPIVPTQSQGSIPVIVPTATSPANTPVFVIPTATIAAPPVVPTDADVEATEEASAEATAETIEVEATVTLALPAAPGGEAEVRFGHFAPGTPAFTIYIDSQPIGTLSTGGLVMTQYLGMPSGQHTLSLVLENETIDQAFLRQTVSFSAGRAYLVAAIGSLDIGSFSVVTAEEDRIPKQGQALIGFFNAVPDVREMALFREGVKKPLLTQVAFPLAYVGAGDGYESVEVVPGNYRLVVAEDHPDETFTDLSTLPELHLGEGRYYTIVITGLKDQPNQPYMIFTSYPPSKTVPNPPPVTATPGQ